MNVIKHHPPHNERLRQESLLLDRIFEYEDKVIDFFYSGGIHNTQLISAYCQPGGVELVFLEEINGERTQWSCDASDYELDMCLGGVS